VRPLTSRWRRPPVEWADAGRHRVVPRHPSLPARLPSFRTTHDGFCFLNETRRFEGAFPWQPEGASGLWLHRLHAFRWIWELPPARAAELVTHWLDHNASLGGAGWEPYPLSLRVREWIEWVLSHPEAPAELRERMITSVAHQVRVLEDRLEHDWQGERLLQNAITLCWAGLSLEGPSSVRWVMKGRALLIQQLGRQMLRDGSHDSRSPMLQAQVAEALLRLAEAAGRTAIARPVHQAARAAGEAFVATLRQLTHPDGEFALLNDTALGEAPTLAELVRRFAVASPDEHPAGAGWSLPQAGYFGVRAGERYLVFDAGPLGPDCQPGHGHADTLAFELSHDGRRLIADSGVFTFEPGELRSGDRGTAAHSTVQVDGVDQAELFGAFGCGRRPRKASGSLRERGSVAVIAGSYLGFARKSRLQHVRECRCDGPWLRFTDRIAAPGAHEAVVRLHVAPGLRVGSSSEGLRILDSGLPLALLEPKGFEWTLDESRYHPEFGKELLRPSLFARTGFADQLTLEWAIRLL
jgi:uncharacterized heparinase superfamily protein